MTTATLPIQVVLGLDPDDVDNQPAILAAARELGVDVEVDRCDWWFVLDMLREIHALPELERPSAVRAVNAGATVADRASYRTIFVAANGAEFVAVVGWPIAEADLADGHMRAEVDGVSYAIFILLTGADAYAARPIVAS